MFTALAKERHKRQVDATHNKIIREAVLDLEYDEETSAFVPDTVSLFVDMDENDHNLNPEEEKVIDEIIGDKDIASMSEEELENLATYMANRLKDLEESSNKDDDCNCE